MDAKHSRDIDNMDSQPKTRKESRKSAKDKAQGKDTCYSSKHVRRMEAIVKKPLK